MNINRMKTKMAVMLKNHKPVLICGAPGVGKTDMVKQVAKMIEFDLIITHPVVADPTDAKGLPGFIDGKAEFLPYGDLRKMMEATKDTIVFLDDLGQAPSCVQAAYMQLILGGEINGNKISDKVVFCAATNRREDRAGVTGILEPVKSRFKTIYQLEADADEWIQWAIDNDMPAELIGFIHFQPQLIHDFKPTNDMTNSPCPRTLAAAGEMMQLGLCELDDLAGAIGEAAAGHLLGFMKIYQALPSISGILLDPEAADVPADRSVLYAVCTALVHKGTKDNADRVIKYANRLSSEFSTLLVRDFLRKVPTISSTKAFIGWAAKHKDVLL